MTREHDRWCNLKRTREPPCTCDAGTIDDLLTALEKIADEQKVYKGHGDYDIIPALTAEEAQTVARLAIQKATA